MGRFPFTPVRIRLISCGWVKGKPPVHQAGSQGCRICLRKLSSHPSGIEGQLDCHKKRVLQSFGNYELEHFSHLPRAIVLAGPSLQTDLFLLTLADKIFNRGPHHRQSLIRQRLVLRGLLLLLNPRKSLRKLCQLALNRSRRHKKVLAFVIIGHTGPRKPERTKSFRISVSDSWNLIY